jgi:hypothetical protein
MAPMAAAEAEMLAILARENEAIEHQKAHTRIPRASELSRKLLCSYRFFGNKNRQAIRDRLPVF